MPLDRLRRLLQRLLALGGDLLDGEDVPAELGLDGAGQLALLGREDGLVERRLLLALGDGEQRAALVLGGLVDRELLGDRLPRLAALEARLGLLGLGLGRSVRTIRRSRRSGWAKRCLFLS
jgi:hypothetical protein